MRPNKPRRARHDNHWLAHVAGIVSSAIPAFSITVVYDRGCNIRFFLDIRPGRANLITAGLSENTPRFHEFNPYRIRADGVGAYGHALPRRAPTVRQRRRRRGP